MTRLHIKALSRCVNFFRLFTLPSHRRRVRQARRLLRRLRRLEHDGQILTYLRKIDPYDFEELVLCLLERDGCLILRNRGYSGDGGLDGRFLWPGFGWVAVQCKRYSNSIDPGHVRDFVYRIRGRFKGGLFVHTGRTGALSKQAVGGMDALCFLSGNDLIQAVRGESALHLAAARNHRRLQGQNGL